MAWHLSMSLRSGKLTVASTYPIRSDSSIWESSSAAEPMAMDKNRRKSGFEPRDAPSAMFDETETAARLVCCVIP